VQGDTFLARVGMHSVEFKVWEQCSALCDTEPCRALLLLLLLDGVGVCRTFSMLTCLTLESWQEWKLGTTTLEQHQVCSSVLAALVCCSPATPPMSLQCVFPITWCCTQHALRFLHPQCLHNSASA
jgi:hypothetical protein